MSNVLLPIGRMRRSEYWAWLVLLSLLASLAGAVIRAMAETETFHIGVACGLLFPLAWLSFTVGAQRAHDTGSPWVIRGFYFMITLVCLGIIGVAVVGAIVGIAGATAGAGESMSPAINAQQPIGEGAWFFGTLAFITFVITNFAVSLSLLFRPGEDGPNRYGPNPRPIRRPFVSTLLPSTGGLNGSRVPPRAGVGTTNSPA